MVGVTEREVTVRQSVESRVISVTEHAARVIGVTDGVTGYWCDRAWNHTERGVTGIGVTGRNVTVGSGEFAEKKDKPVSGGVDGGGGRSLALSA
eukprot:1348021-Amorphochlora_amoeboformis.AAC.1